MSQLAAGGGQPQKQPKYASIYNGRFFNGLNTNRSPLRAASSSHIYEKFYSDNSGDALIAGSNIEVSNRLTLVRRPGNPIYSNLAYNNPDGFDEFRVNKAQSDGFNNTSATPLENIFTMIDETGAGKLYSLTSGGTRGGNLGLSFQKNAAAGQSFMQEVGNSLYFANGVQNKKWLTSLFTRVAAGNNTFLQGTDGLAGTYPFGTFLIDPANGNPQEFIGITIGTITNVSVAAGVLSLTVTMTSDTFDYAIGSTFQLWGMTGANDWLNGFTLALSTKYDHTLVGRKLVGFATHADYTSTETGQGFVIQTGTTPVIAKTGGSVPTYGTVLPSSANSFMGSLTLDGNTVWANRGVSYGDGNQPAVENWGIKAPTTAPTYSGTGAAVSWQKNTYYSPVSIFIDPLHGNLWQITQAGVTGNSQPAWSVSPTAQQKVVIRSVYSDGANIFFTTDTQSPALVAGDTVTLQNMCAFGPGNGSFPNLNGVQLTVSATGLTTTAFRAPYTANVIPSIANPVAEYGQALKTNAATTLADGAAIWTCIQLAASLVWKAHTHYNVGDFIVSGSGYVFQLGPQTQPFIFDTIDFYTLNEPLSNQNSAWQGSNQYFNAADPHPGTVWPTGSQQHQTLSGTYLLRQQPPGFGDSSTPFAQYPVNGAGEIYPLNAAVLANLSFVTSSWVGSMVTRIFIPKAGAYTFTLQHSDGAIFTFDSQQAKPGTVVAGAYKQTSTGRAGFTLQSMSPQAGLGAPGGNDLTGTNDSQRCGQGPFGPILSTIAADSATWNFPQAGAYYIEVAYAKWYHSGGYCILLCSGNSGNPTQAIATGINISGATAPTWPAFKTSGAGWDATQQRIKWGARVTEDTSYGQQYTWNNVGPKSSFVWSAGVMYTLPGTGIIDTNGNEQVAYETGISSTVQPVWTNTTVGQILAVTTAPLSFMNTGSVPAALTPQTTITALSQQGWLYWVALVNTLDQTVSNVSPVSLSSGPINKGQITFPAGSGLNAATLDPQADYVAIFRTADGFTTPLLIPGFGNSPYTVPLAQYMRNGYIDVVPDSELNNLVQGAQAGENTPPPVGAQNLAYHLSRIWFSLGNTVYWTTGPLAPIGNGTDGVSPANFASCPSQVKRLVPTAIGMLVFTVSDIYIIAGNGTDTSPLLPAIPYLTGVGLGSYNSLDINGGLIGFFTTDGQFVIFDPSAGLHYVGFNIGNLLRQNNGVAGTSWNPSKVYVSWYVNGEDQAWYVADGQFGWYRLIATPAPEQGSVAWSPFATIAGGAGAIKSVETSPGVHTLLVGQTGSSSAILNRDLTATTDGGTTGANGTAYSAYGVLGSIVLAQPGQIAKIAFLSTDSVKVGSPLTLGVILDEALPYFTGAFDILKNWVTDPPGLPESGSILSQRFYLSENEQNAGYCKHLQILFQWPAEAALNELQTFSIYGAYEVEQ